VRRFVDRTGRRWDVVIGRESWGAHCALFVALGEGGEVRQVALRASARDEAMTELDALDDDGLQQMLDTSRIREAE
jgi:hypothetical protein